MQAKTNPENGTDERAEGSPSLSRRQSLMARAFESAGRTKTAKPNEQAAKTSVLSIDGMEGFAQLEDLAEKSRQENATLRGGSVLTDRRAGQVGGPGSGAEGISAAAPRGARRKACQETIAAAGPQSSLLKVGTL